MKKELQPDTRDKWILFVIVLVGGFLRLYKLDSESLWYDELHSIVPTAPNQSVASIIEYCKTDQPPFYFLYLHYFFKLFGYNEWIGRFASVVVGIAAIPVIFVFGKELQNRTTGLIAAGLTAVNYFHIYYSQELRFYSMAFLLSALSFLFIVRIIHRNKIVDYVFYILSTSALLYTHYFGVIIFATQLVVLLIVRLLPEKREPSLYYRSLTAGGIVALSFVPWLPTLLQDIKIEEFWIPIPKITFPVRYFFDYTGKDEISAVIFAILVLFFLVHFIKTENRKNASYWILVVWVAVSFALPYLRSIYSTPILHIRYTIVTLPALFLIISIGWSAIAQKRYAKLLVIFVGCSSMVNLFFIESYYSVREKSQLRETCEYLKTLNLDSTNVYSNISWHLNYYFRDSKHKIKALPSHIEEKTFWLVVYGSKSERSNIRLHYCPTSSAAEPKMIDIDLINCKK